MVTAQALRIEGIDEVAAVDLKEHLPEGAVRRVRMPRPTGGRLHGEPISAVAAVVAVSVPAIQALATWLAKRRVKTTDEQELTFRRDPDGTVTVTLRGRLEYQGSEPADPLVADTFLDQLRAWLGDPPAVG